MERYELISYANDFVSFLLKDKNLFNKVKKVVLFGSVPRGDFTKESDIDIFIDVVKENEGVREVIKQREALFSKSQLFKKWRIKGVEQEISLKIGRLEEWNDLERSIISDGYVLYGKYEEKPEDVEQEVLVKLSFGQREKKEKVKLWRKLYGYSQKVGDKRYTSQGLVDELNAEKIGRGVLIIKMQFFPKLQTFLKKNNISYEVFEIWREE